MGKVKYVEVKTTRGSKNSAFYMTMNEVEFSRAYKDDYYIYRVYEYDSTTNSGKLFKITHDILEMDFNLTPLQFRVSL